MHLDEDHPVKACEIQSTGNHEFDLTDMNHDSHHLYIF